MTSRVRTAFPDDIAGALDRIVRRSTRAIDLLEVNGRPFVTAGGIGIGAHTALVVPWIKALHPLARMAADSLGSAVYRIAAGANVMFRPGLTERVRLTWRVPGRGGGSVRTEVRAHGRVRGEPADVRRGHGAAGAGGQRGRCAGRVRRARRGPRAAARRADAAVARLGDRVERLLGVARGAGRRSRRSETSAFFGCGDLMAEGTKFDVRVVPGALRVLV